MALVTKRTAAAGGTDATVTSAAGLWGVIDALLIAAGWTVLQDYSVGVGGWTQNTPYSVGTRIEVNGFRFQCITSGTSAPTGTGPNTNSQSFADGSVVWRTISSAGASDKIYTSTGESGNDKLFCRVNYSTIAPTPTVNVFVMQYHDTGTGFSYNVIYAGGTAANQPITQHTITTGNTQNYVFVADKDNWVGIVADSVNNARRMMGGGNLKRMPGTIATTFTSNGTVTAGTNQTFSFASGNPIAAGYKVGDKIFVMSQQSNAGSPHNGTIPCFACTIIALTTSSITVDNAQETTSAGALVGADPMPAYHYNNIQNVDPVSSANHAYILARWNAAATNLYTSQQNPALGYPNATGGGHLIVNAATETDPDNRTSRVAIGEILFLYAPGAGQGQTGEVSGIIPKIYSNPRTTDALWSIARTTKEATNFDYVTVPDSLPATGRRTLIGPIAVSGSSTYTAQLYNITSDIYMEGFQVRGMDGASVSSDRARGVIPMIGNQPEGIWGETFVTPQTDLFADAVFLPNIQQQSDRATGPLTVQVITAEPIPQDSPGAVVGGSGSGFNSGMN